MRQPFHNLRAVDFLQPAISGLPPIKILFAPFNFQATSRITERGY